MFYLVQSNLMNKFNGWGIAFDEEVSGSFDNKFARNVAIFSIDNSSSYHTDNRKNIFLVLGKGKDQLMVLIIALVQQKKKLTLVNQIQNFVYYYITMVMRVT